MLEKLKKKEKGTKKRKEKRQVQKERKEKNLYLWSAAIIGKAGGGSDCRSARSAWRRLQVCKECKMITGIKERAKRKGAASVRK
jgi:hypothetical protein